MPVRKIPKNYLVVTGGFASKKNGRLVGFESLLEKDYMILLEYDDSVEGFEEQPVKIPVTAPKKRKTKYVPDVLVCYRQKSGPKQRKPLLVEIKSSRDLIKNKAKYAARFSAARKLAAEKGWIFKILDETDVRRPCLGFLKFLREYHCIDPSTQDVAKVIDGLKSLKGKARYCDLIDHLCAADDEKLERIPVIWHLVATKRILTDLNQPVSDQVLLELPRRGTRS